MTTVAGPGDQISVSVTIPDAETSAGLIELVDRYSAHNYHPLPVVVADAEGAWVTDVEGRRYLDMLSAYSALNFGHRHPALIGAAVEQLERVTLTSRAFHNDRLGPFCQDLAELCGMDMVLPMNTGAEAVETALKTARRWGYDVKGVPQDRAEDRRLRGELPRPHHHHRRASAPTPTRKRAASGRSRPASSRCPTATRDALDAALADPDVVGFLVEPIQGEAGVVVPPEGYLRAGPRALHASTASSWSPTRSSPAWAAPARPSRASTKACGPTSTSSGRRWAAASCP